MKRFGMFVATAALCAVVGASGPSLAFDGDGQHCCGWRYGGDYSYGCGCYYGYVPGLAGLAVGRLALAASFPFAPVVASVWAAPPRTGAYCASSQVMCLLLQPLPMGEECLCRTHSGYSPGLVQ
jgi:hypothetical protein